MILKLAWRNIWRNRRRTFITAASIVFAVLLAILMNSVKEGVLYRLQENVVTFYTGAVQVHGNGYWDEQSLDLSFEDTDSLRQNLLQYEEVNAVIGRLESFALGASTDKSKGCLVVGVEPEKEDLVTSLKSKLIDGEYLDSGKKAVLIAEGMAEYLGLATGDTLVIIGQGFHGINAAGKYPVIGIIKFPSPELNKSMVYLPLNEAQYLFGAENRLTALVLDIEEVVEAEALTKSIRKDLPNNLEVMGWKKMLPELDQMIQGERAESAIFLFVLYMLIAFGIFGTVLMMTLERQYEFGVLVAIGMRKLKLSSVIILENILISFLGALTGTVLSVPVVSYFHNYPIRITGDLEKAYENFGFEPTFYFSIAPEIFYSQTLVVLSVALVLSVYPLVKVLSIDPVKAMRT